MNEYNKKQNVINFLDSVGHYAEDTEFLYESLLCLQGNDKFVIDGWQEWVVKEAGFVQGVADFGRGVVTGAKQAYADTTTKQVVQEIINSAQDIGVTAKKFSEKFHVDPIISAIILCSGLTGGLGAIPPIALAYALRKGISWTANKAFDKVWEGITGMSVDEADKLWQSKMNQPQQPQVQQPQTKTALESCKMISFESFLQQRDMEFLKDMQYMNEDFKSIIGNIASKGREYLGDIKQRGFGTVAGETVGKAIGTAAGSVKNFVEVIKKTLAHIGKFIKNNPVKTSQIIIGTIAGSMIGHYSTSYINSFLEHPTPEQVQQVSQAAQEAGISNADIAGENWADEQTKGLISPVGEKIRKGVEKGYKILSKTAKGAGEAGEEAEGMLATSAGMARSMSGTRKV